jgi:hypothetical protein
VTFGKDDDDARESGEPIPKRGKPIDPNDFGGDSSTEAHDREITESSDRLRAVVGGVLEDVLGDLFHQRNGVTPDDAIAVMLRRLGYRARGVADNSSPLPELVELWAADADPFDFENTELVRLDRLPGPPDWTAHASVVALAGQNSFAHDVDSAAGYGVGAHLNDILGGGLRGSETLLVGAAGPGAGKTFFAGQIADGLALRTAEMLRDPERWHAITRTLTPVTVMSELSTTELLERSFARYTGIPKNAFRQGRHWSGQRVQGAELIDLNPRDAQRIANSIARGALAPLREQVRRLRVETKSNPAATVELARRAVAASRKSVAARAPEGLAVIPVLVIDPVQRFQGQDDDEVSALNKLIELLHEAAIDDDFILLCTSDTNKDSSVGNAGGRATGERAARERGSKVLRGSTKLLHLVEVSTYLDRDYDVELANGYGEVELGIGKNRNGPGGPPFARFRWHYATGRMFACAQSYAARMHRELAGQSQTDPAKQSTTSKNTGNAGRGKQPSKGRDSNASGPPVSQGDFHSEEQRHSHDDLGDDD